MSTMKSMNLSLMDLIRMAFESGYNAGWDATGEGDNAEYSNKAPEEWTSNMSKKLTEFLVILGLDELKVS